MYALVFATHVCTGMLEQGNERGRNPQDIQRTLREFHAHKKHNLNAKKWLDEQDLNLQGTSPDMGSKSAFTVSPSSNNVVERVRIELTTWRLRVDNPHASVLQ
jgi:hypothetical protein